MRLYILVFVVLSMLFCQERTFNLKDGNKINGVVINVNENGNYTVQTDLGNIFINKDDLTLETIKITTKNGDTVIGQLINEDMEMYYIKSNIGSLSVDKKNIINLEYIHASEKDYDNWESLSPSNNLFYFGDEQLIDLWFDPTANILEEGTIYLSGLSGAYGVSDKFQISLRFWDFIFGNVNIRPKYQIYKEGTLENSTSVSIGGHFYLSGAPPHKWELEKLANNDSMGDDYGYWKPITTNEASYQVFVAYTNSSVKSSGKGRINYNLGFSQTKIGGYDDLMPRLWAGVDIDVRKKLKLVSLVAYDKNLPTISELFSQDYKDKEQTNIHLDVGFIYAYNENFRFGIHLTSPFLAFYWKI